MTHDIKQAIATRNEDNMSDNLATLDGYTQEVHAFAGEGLELYLLVQPGTDFDGHFRAWDMDAQEYITVTGWMFTVEAQ